MHFCLQLVRNINIAVFAGIAVFSGIAEFAGIAVFTHLRLLNITSKIMIIHVNTNSNNSNHDDVDDDNNINNNIYIKKMIIARNQFLANMLWSFPRSNIMPLEYTNSSSVKKEKKCTCISFSHTFTSIPIIFVGTRA